MKPAVPQPLPFSPAAERNRDAILAQLQERLPATGRALEVAAGTGQHAVHFAAGLPGWKWWPTDAETTSLRAIAQWVGASGVTNVAAPQLLDVVQALQAEPAVLAQQLGQDFDLVYAANLLHIAPWDACAGLMQVATALLAPQGQLITYGPYLERDVPTSAGNASFDASLRQSDPRWDLRLLNEVAAEAARFGLRLLERQPMPASNLLLVWGRAAT